MWTEAGVAELGKAHLLAKLFLSNLVWGTKLTRETNSLNETRLKKMVLEKLYLISTSRKKKVLEKEIYLQVIVV